jgi:glutamate synthase (NADPH/NADH) small chain
MADPKGFLKVQRRAAPKRPVHERVTDHRHVYVQRPEAELRLQASRCMDCGVPFCNSGCPLGNLIPDWNDLVYRDRWHAAIDRLHMTNNFPEFTGFLCPAPCETSCVLAITNDAVTIKEIELSIVERAWENGWIVPRPPRRSTGRRIAVIGSGPAGLAGAQQLRRAGHDVTVFEKDDRVGGLLRYGIPDFKLEKWVIDRRIDQMWAEGVTFSPNTHVGVDITVDELRDQFDAVLLAVGALAGRDLPVPGRDLAGIHPAMDYLVQRNRAVAGDPLRDAEIISARGKRVVVLGGGDTSADCLGFATREGAASVQVLTHGPRPPDEPHPLEWPDWPFVLRTYPAHEEGGERDWSVVVTHFSGENGTVGRLHTQRVERLPDGANRRLPGSEEIIHVDLVLLAIGFSGPVRDDLLHLLPVEFSAGGAIAADATYRTAVDSVYVAGDARRGASLIVWAIAEGRKAAAEIDAALSPSTLPGLRLS